MSQLGNTQAVIDLLNYCAELARQHKLAHVAIAMVGHKQLDRQSKEPNAVISYNGEVELEADALDAVTKLREAIAKAVKGKQPPKRDRKLREDHACYNTAAGALGFDFVVWLVNVEMRRRQARAPGPLKVGFFLGAPTAEYAEKRDAWLANVFRPALRLIGAVEDKRAIHAEVITQYTTSPIVAAFHHGEDVPPLEPPEPLPYDGAITITLREAEHYTERNSNLEAWMRFAFEREAKGERVIFIRDTAKADEPIPGFETCPQASRNLLYRCARYAASKANLFVSNGPATLAVFGTRPWLQFIPVEDSDSGYRANKPDFWRHFHGIGPGEQYPWSGPAQRIVWGTDDYENINAAWLEIAPHLQEH